MDSSALVFLVCRAVEDRKKKEDDKVKVEVKMERIEDMMCDGAPVSSADMAAWRRWATKDCPSSSVSKKRKKRKRREKKLPRGRPLRLGRAHRLCPGRGGLVCSWVLRSRGNCEQLLPSCCSALKPTKASCSGTCRWSPRWHDPDDGDGDQGIMFRYACVETEDDIPLTHSSATCLGKNLTGMRKNGALWCVRPDDKTHLGISTPLSFSLNMPCSPQAVCYKKVAEYTGLGENAPSMDEMNKFIDEKVLKKTVEEIILNNGQFQPALSLYRTHLGRRWLDWSKDQESMS